ncbi:MAG: murein biosynthesis integral membrane protein MurJ [bacterium]
MAKAMSSIPIKSEEQSRSAHKNLVISAGIISGATLFSRILGFLRDMIMANMFGAEIVTDAFLVAFRLPDLLRRLMGEGALSASFVPVFTEYLHKKEEQESWELVNNLISLTIIILIVIVILSILFAPWIIKICAPGYTMSQRKLYLTTLLARILFPYIFFIGVGSLAMGILNSLNHFLAPALSPALLNIGIISGAYLISPRLKEPIVGLAIGVLLGGLAQLIFELPILIHKGLKFQFALNFHHEGLRRIGTLMLPSAFGLAVGEINSMIDTVCATFLPEGSVSYLYYSNRLIQFPQGLFAMAIGTAILPAMSGQAARGEINDLKETFSFGLRLVMFITLPATAGLILCRHSIIRILFQRGAFTAEATQATATALLLYAIGLFAYAGVSVIVPVFYSFQDTRTPVNIASICLILNICMNIVLMWPLKHGGLALATSLSSTFQFFFLAYYLRKKMGPLGGRKISISCLKIVGASSLTGAVAWGMIQYGTLHALSRTSQVLALMLIIFISSLVYAGISYLMGSPEMFFLIDTLRRKI